MNSLPKGSKVCSFPVILNDFEGGSVITIQNVELAACEKSCEREQAVLPDDLTSSSDVSTKILDNSSQAQEKNTAPEVNDQEASISEVSEEIQQLSA